MITTFKGIRFCGEHASTSPVVLIYALVLEEGFQFLPEGQVQEVTSCAL